MKRALLIAAACLVTGPLNAAVVCSVTATGVAFGTYNPFNSTALDSTGTITVTCITVLSTAETYTVKLSTGGAGSYTRRMSSGGNTLQYNLYVDSARSSIWGDGTGGTTYQTYSGTLPAGTTINNYTVYARMPALQSAQIGIYADTITVTVNY
jgi:spore coat protein U-like protein